MFNNSFTNLRSFYRLESSSWFDSGYIGDWLFATLLWFIGEAIDHSDVFERDFRLDDPLISHPHTKQQIGGHTNNLIAVFVPLLCVLYVSLRRKSYIDFHHGALGLWVSRSLTHLITEFLKNRVGRLRPDFLARCKWREAIQQCTGKAGDIIDGRSLVLFIPSTCQKTAIGQLPTGAYSPHTRPPCICYMGCRIKSRRLPPS
ncbi:lipid phosphate phosphatase 1 [Pyrrhoderma noxium]|uniref:Lipid phosphate phosphatase 1 n=1 Tax=Pyrrhoderma noxium TaxID=2282107 RepID=A0A286UJT3_9AGAM|nr:lipid phosphate phosphatase 1 [Pyrrhoderma noxium]